MLVSVIGLLFLYLLSVGGYRYIHTLTFIILLITHGEEDLICQRKWHIHI